MKRRDQPAHKSIRVIIPASVTSDQELIEIIAKGLRFPSWHGSNWNALFDSLCDLTWLGERRVVIEHAGMPELEPGDLKEYLRVLADAVGSWQVRQAGKTLVVEFPRTEKGSGFKGLLPKSRV